MAENQGRETGKGAKRQRRQFSAVEKRRLLDETEKPGESVSPVARRYWLSPSMLFAWCKAMEAGAATGLHAEGIMRRNKLLFERCTGDGRGRKHDGVIVTLKPDLRWCSDSFEIRCWSGERVHVTFVLDCCDREVAGFVSAPEPLCGEQVRDMMVQAVDHRFGADTRKLTNPIEFLRQRQHLHLGRNTGVWSRNRLHHVHHAAVLA